MVNKPSRVVAVANEKGGVGKTVTVLNVGAALSRGNQRVLVVDMDPQFNATLGLGLELKDGQPSIYDLIKNDASVPVERAIVHTPWKGLDLIPSHVDLAGAEVELVDQEGRENRLREALAGIRRQYDFILIDTPPSLSLLTINVLAFASEVLVPCQTHPYAFSALHELFDTIAAVRQAINPQLQIGGIVATFFDRRTRVSHRTLEKLKGDDRYRGLLFDTIIRVNTTIAESADAGKPIVFYRPGSAGASDYVQLADELLNQQPSRFDKKHG